jgi:hypothetical protein
LPYGKVKSGIQIILTAHFTHGSDPDVEVLSPEKTKRIAQNAGAGVHLLLCARRELEKSNSRNHLELFTGVEYNDCNE